MYEYDVDTVRVRIVRVNFPYWDLDEAREAADLWTFMNMGDDVTREESAANLTWDDLLTT